VTRYPTRLAKAVPILLLIALLFSACVTETFTPSKSPPPPQHTEVIPRESSTPTPLADVTPEERATTVPPQLESGKGAIIGIVLKEDGTYPAENVKVFLASFFWNEEKTEGVFILDPDRATSVPISDQGAFRLVNIEPGNYVLVVGVTPEAAVVILGDRGQARVIEVNAGEVVDIGEQRVSLP
jgi:hypothetical protein